jgi:hypothetical protein
VGSPTASTTPVVTEVEPSTVPAGAPSGFAVTWTSRSPMKAPVVGSTMDQAHGDRSARRHGHHPASPSDGSVWSGGRSRRAGRHLDRLCHVLGGQCGEQPGTRVGQRCSDRVGRAVQGEQKPKKKP